ncbi:MAG: AraC family transcriptional regulator [Clostridia bacterium]|nr:AraC family transcriptional regulator [Clostridia bacterium]
MINDKKSSELFRLFGSCSTNNNIDEELYINKSLVAFFPVNGIDIVPSLQDLISKDSSLKNSVCFSNGINIYALLDDQYDKIYAMARRILKQLRRLGLNCVVLFSGRIKSFENACMTFAGINWQSTQLIIGKTDVDIVYYDNSLYLFNAYNESINASKDIGQQIRNDNGSNIELLVDKFFEKLQQGSLLRSHIHFFIMQMLDAAVGEDVLNDNMTLILEYTNRLQLKNLVVDICLSNIQNSSKKDNKEQVVERICSIIDSEYSKELSLDIIAKRVYLSPTYVSRIFKECKGVNFAKYIKNLRLCKAKELLENENFASKNINQIAEMVGLPNVAFFCASFKENYGVSPTKYRRNLKV